MVALVVQGRDDQQSSRTCPFQSGSDALKVRMVWDPNGRSWAVRRALMKADELVPGVSGHHMAQDLVEM